MANLYERLDKFRDSLEGKLVRLTSLEGKLVRLTMGTVGTTAFALDLPRTFSTNNYKLAVCEIAVATYLGITTYLEGGKIAKEYKK